jgi:hypothetical protein
MCSAASFYSHVSSCFSEPVIFVNASAGKNFWVELYFLTPQSLLSTAKGMRRLLEPLTNMPGRLAWHDIYPGLAVIRLVAEKPGIEM